MGARRSYNIQISAQPMNYQESNKILAEVKMSDKILINCHRSPDGDSVGSALAMRKVLLGLGKEVEVVCPDNIQSDLKFLTSSDKVVRVNYDEFDFSKYQLFLILDSADWSQVLGFGSKNEPPIKKVVIDHHFTNSGFGDLNIVDADRSSTGEVLYRLFEDWEVKLDKETAEDLLAGIIYDTSLLEYPSADVATASAVVALMKLGADKNKIIFNFYKNISFDKVKLIGEIIKNLEIDKEKRFVWSAIPYETFILYPDSSGVKSMAANMFASSIEAADFGIIMIEEKKNFLNASLRAKEGFDISKIAEELGGGGHKLAGAFRLKEIPFDQAVLKVLEAVRKYAKKD